MRRKVLAVTGVLGLATAGGLAAGAAPALAQPVPEVVLTSDFEDGTTQGWFGRGSAELAASDAQAYAGDYSLLTTGRTAGWHGPAYDLLDILLPRAVYRFDAQVRVLAGEPAAPIQLTMQFVPESTGQTTWQQIAAAPSVTDQEWVGLSGEYTPPEPGFELQFYAESTDPTASFYVDEVVVTMVEPPPDIESEVSLDLALAGVADSSHVVTYRTDQQHSLARIGESTVVGSDLAVELPPRSLTTLVIEDCTTAVISTVGGLSVRSGVTCLADGAQVTGPVTVHEGAGLVATGATVTGAVAANGAATVRLVDATVTGPVLVSRTTDQVVISGSEVAGPVAVLANDTGFAPPVVAGNTLGGPLSCRGNTPAPVNEGVPNSVAGPAGGQCQGL